MLFEERLFGEEGLSYGALAEAGNTSHSSTEARMNDGMGVLQLWPKQEGKGVKCFSLRSLPAALPTGFSLSLGSPRRVALLRAILSFSTLPHLLRRLSCYNIIGL